MNYILKLNRGKKRGKNLMIRLRKKLKKYKSENQFIRKLKKSTRNPSKCPTWQNVKNNWKTSGTFTSPSTSLK